MHGAGTGGAGHVALLTASVTRWPSANVRPRNQSTESEVSQRRARDGDAGRENTRQQIRGSIIQRGTPGTAGAGYPNTMPREAVVRSGTGAGRRQDKTLHERSPRSWSVKHHMLRAGGVNGGFEVVARAGWQVEGGSWPGWHAAASDSRVYIEGQEDLLEADWGVLR